MGKTIVLLSLLVIGIAGCKQKLDAWKIEYPAELEYQISLFKEHAPSGLRAREVTIVLTGPGVRSKDGVLCAGLSSPRNKRIYLDTTSMHWIKTRTALVLHELGHYVLDRKHNQTFFYHPSNSVLEIPESVMIPQPYLKEEYIRENQVLQDYYLNELFNGE
jgi:hypothetical protein